MNHENMIWATPQLSLLPQISVGCLRLTAETVQDIIINTSADIYIEEGRERMRTSACFTCNVKLTWPLVIFAWDFKNNRNLNADLY